MSWCNQFSCWQLFWWSQRQIIYHLRSCGGRYSIRLRTCFCFVFTTWLWRIKGTYLCSCWLLVLVRIQVWLLLICWENLQITSFVQANKLFGFRFLTIFRRSRLIYSLIIVYFFIFIHWFIELISILGFCNFLQLQLSFSWDLKYFCLLHQLAL